MFHRKKIKKKNELRLKHYQNLTLNLLKNNTLPLTPEEKINGVNKINKILISGVQQRIFERGVLKNDFSYNHYDHRYFFETYGIVPKCPTCGEIESEENHHSLKNPITFYPNADPLLSFPWNQSRIDTLQYIGFRTGHPFTNHPSNHFSTYFYPINLFLATNGFHSQFSGIYDNGEFATAQQLIDISQFYDHYFFDGNHFRHYICNKIVDTPEDLEIGILYELGRIYLDFELNFKSYYKLKP